MFSPHCCHQGQPPAIIAIDTLGAGMRGQEGGSFFQQNIVPPLEALHQLSKDTRVPVLVLVHTDDVVTGAAKFSKAALARPLHECFKIRGNHQIVSVATHMLMLHDFGDRGKVLEVVKSNHGGLPCPNPKCVDKL